METRQECLQTNLELEHKFADDIKALLGQYFFTKDMKEDLEGGTDFAIFYSDPVRVAVRIRRWEIYLHRIWRQQFTIRWKLASGHITEIDKINSGLVDYIFYAFINKNESKIIKYIIGDLEVFRNAEVQPIEVKPNKDGYSWLAAFHPTQFPKEFLLKEYTP